MSTDTDDRALLEQILARLRMKHEDVEASALSRLLAEHERLQKVIDAAAKHWLALEPGIAWEGGLDAAMAAACAEIEALRADKERLEYLIEHRSSIAAHSTDAGGTVWAVGPHAEIVSARDCHATLRAAIDAAREIAKPHTSSGLEVAK